MSNIPVLKPQEVVRILENLGFIEATPTNPLDSYNTDSRSPIVIGLGNQKYQLKKAVNDERR
jgi:hypothetical protein